MKSKANNKKLVLAFTLLSAVIFAAGCVQQQSVTSVTIDNVEYQFSNDIRKALMVPVNDKVLLRQILLGSRNIDVIFDCSAPDELPSFSVAAHNAVSAIQNYFVYSQGRFASFDTYCFKGDQWYNSTNGEIEKPELGVTLWFKGQKTGASGTSVLLENNTIIIQGTNHKNLTLATDAFSLAFLGVDKV